MFEYFHRELLICLSVAVLNAHAQNGPQVELTTDLLSLFKPGRVHEALSCEIRQPASAGGIKEDALFEHPLTVRRPARVEYDLDLPPASESQPLLLAFDIALSDGIQAGKVEDGVRFIVEVNGRQVFARDTIETRWQPHAVDLTPFANRPVRLALLTDALGNTSYDWALWGRPRLLLFRNAGSVSLGTNQTGRIPVSAPIGALAVKSTHMFKLRLEPDSDESPILIAKAGSDAPEQWLVRDFTFTNAEKVFFDWESKGPVTASSLWIGAYAPSLQLLRLAPARALVNAGDSVPVVVEVRNQGRGPLSAGTAQVQLRIGKSTLPAHSLPKLPPGGRWRSEWLWQAPKKAGTLDVRAELKQTDATARLSSRLDVFAPSNANQEVSIENETMRIEFLRHPNGFAGARILTRKSNGWVQAAVWSPLFRVVNDTKSAEQARQISPGEARLTNASRNSVLFVQTARDADGVDWESLLRVSLETNRPVARIRYQWKAAQPRRVRQLLGPNLYPGDGSSGEAKSWGLFPGLEFLFGPERSSNSRDFAPNLADRRTPHPHKVTIPLMAVTIGPESEFPPEKAARFFTPDSLEDRPPSANANSAPRGSTTGSETTVGLWWNNFQCWDGEHVFPSARFASPNFDEGMNNHRLALFLPSTPDFVTENAERARVPYELPANKAVTLEASLVVESGPANVALREYLRDNGGLPKANPWPRSFQSELDVCRAGFLKTVWDDKTERWSHCIGWAGSHAPGFAALLWLDSQLTEQPESRRRSRERVELAVRNMLRESGPGVFNSQANCHIMQWEFPFLYGYLPEAVTGLEGQMQHLIQTQRPDGGWVYQPADAQQAELGRPGDSVLGTCANRAATLLRYARITGDTNALAAGEMAMRFMERFRVPRGGQTWECPMYEPDILAAAYAIRAYHDGYRVTGNPRWLHDAVYWAETGVPFIYLWSLPDKPMMLGATIPVFGSTFYTHTWLSVPVQWCGLVYAYHVFHLARDLERASLLKTDSPLPLALNFSAADWRRIVELITVSATYQQFANGDKIGAYPDSIAQFERRNPAFINPEDILVNVLALHGYDPDVKTARLRQAARNIVVSSGAEIEGLDATADGIRFKLNFFAGESSHSLLAGIKPSQILVNGRPLPKSADPVRREPGWWLDSTRRWVCLVVRHDQKSVNVEILEGHATARRD